MQTFTTNGSNNLNIFVTTRDDLNRLLAFTVTSSGAVVDLSGRTFTAAILHNDTSTPITVTNTDLAGGQITISLDKVYHATIGVGQWRWYLTSAISGVDVDELTGEYNIS